MNWLFRQIVPLLLIQFMKNTEKRQGYRQQPRSKSHKEGEVKIDKIQQKNKKIDKELGKYVDYEELN